MSDNLSIKLGELNSQKTKIKQTLEHVRRSL